MLITFESGECGGKDTQIVLLKSRLVESGYTVAPDFWEPGSTLKSEVIRLLLKNKHNSDFEFPGDFIKTFDLAKYRKDFLQEEVPPIATKYLNQALIATKKLGEGIKHETIYFLLHNHFLQHGNLAHAISYFNSDEMQEYRKKYNATPAELLFKSYFSEEKLNVEAQMCLFMAARNILYHNVIPDALKEHDFVIVNRSRDSTTVYQGHAQGPSLKEKIREVNDEVTEGIFPDITMLLDLPIEEIAKRKAHRSEKAKYSGITKDFFDEKEEKFHELIREGYLKEAEFYSLLPSSHPEYNRIKVINANGSQEEVHERIWTEVKNKLKQK